MYGPFVELEGFIVVEVGWLALVVAAGYVVFVGRHRLNTVSAGPMRSNFTLTGQLNEKTGQIMARTNCQKSCSQTSRIRQQQQQSRRATEARPMRANCSNSNDDDDDFPSKNNSQRESHTNKTATEKKRIGSAKATGCVRESAFDECERTIERAEIRKTNL